MCSAHTRAVHQLRLQAGATVREGQPLQMRPVCMCACAHSVGFMGTVKPADARRCYNSTHTHTLDRTPLTSTPLVYCNAPAAVTT